MQYMGSEDVLPVFPLTPSPSFPNGYLQSCRNMPHRQHDRRLQAPPLPSYTSLARPLASVVTFGARDASVNMYEIGDRMSKKGLHLNTLSGPAAMHIACTGLTLQVVETFTSDLKVSVAETKNAPEERGRWLRCTITLYRGFFLSSRHRRPVRLIDVA